MDPLPVENGNYEANILPPTSWPRPVGCFVDLETTEVGHCQFRYRIYLTEDVGSEECNCVCKFRECKYVMSDAQIGLKFLLCIKPNFHIFVDNPPPPPQLPGPVFELVKFFPMYIHRHTHTAN